MWDRRMIGVPNSPGKATVSMELPAAWPVNAVAHRREAAVGGNCLTYVTVLSALEAAQINEIYKRMAADDLRRNAAAHGEDHVTRHLDEIAVEAGAHVDRLLEAIKQEGYFSSWVVIEECTID